MQNFTLGRKGLNWFLFAFILFIGNLASYGQAQDCATPGSDQNYCYLETIDDLRYSNATNGAVYESADTENDTDPIDGDELLTDGTTYFIGSTTEDCNRVPVTVAVDSANTPMNTITNNRGSFTISPCESAGFTASELEDLFVADSGYDLEVYGTEFGETALAPTDPLAAGNSYFVGQVDADTTDSNDLCPSTRAAVGFDPLESPTPTADANQTYCEGATVADLMASGTEPNTQAIRWYRSQTSNSPLADDVELVNGEDYFAAQVVNDRNSPFPPCETVKGERREVIVEVISFDAGDDVIGEICEDDLRERIADGEGSSILLNFITDGRDLPNNVTFNPSLGSLAQQFENDPTQPIITTATFTTPEECTDDINFNIEINESFEAGDDNTQDNTTCRATFSAVATEGEVTDFLMTLLSSDADNGGTFSNVTSITDNINAGSEGPFMSTYTVGSGEPCEDSADLAFEIDEADELGTQTGDGIYCQSEIDSRIAGTTMYEELARELFLEQLDSSVSQNGDFTDMTLAEVVDAYTDGVRSFMTTYSVTTESGCTSSGEISFDILEDAPANAGSFDDIENVCTNEDSIDLTTLPNNDPDATMGGTFSGSGVNNNQFDPSIGEGTYTITYSVDDTTPCTTDSDETTFTITVEDTPINTNISRSLCVTDAQDLISNPIAGFEFLQGLVEEAGVENFDADNFGDGTVSEATSLSNFIDSPTSDSETFNFEYTDPANSVCDSEIISISITINNIQDANAGDIDNQVACTTDGIIALNQFLDGSGAQMGGTFSGEGVTNNMFDTSIGINEDGYLITYSISEEDSECIEGQDSTTFRIFVNEPGQAIAEAMNDEINVCTSETSYNLNAALSEDSTLGGTFLLNGEELDGNIFDASTVEAGEYSFTYTVSSEDADCIEGEASTSFMINVTSNFDFGNNITAVLCESEVPENLTADIIEDFYLGLVSGLPSGGTFDTTAEEILAQYNNNPFDTFATTYTVDNGECQGSVVVSVTIQEEGPANAGDIDDQVACTTDGMIALNQFLDGSGAQMGGTFSGEGVTDNMFDTSIGTNEEGYLITYSINGEDSECIEGQDSTTFRVFVNEPGQAIAEAMNDEINVCTSETSYNLNAALSEDSTLGGTFLLNGEELDGNIFDASTVEAGEYSFTYTVSSEDADCIEGEASTSFM
ncbi:hypothetical protein [Christiangramia forsetii]|nr:hypothetical protein [Christiangramia forsetii]GGG21337.1 hypothetical protein GCM10011532_00410 [Christiangramia forsetii]